MNFYDTNALLVLVDELKPMDIFYISSITLEELEHIKVSRNKDDSIKYQARKTLRYLTDNVGSYNVIICDNHIHDILQEMNLPETPDNQICACAQLVHTYDHNVQFVTNDLACFMIASELFKIPTTKAYKTYTDYQGYKTVVVTDEELAYLYTHMYENIYNLLTNEYVIITDTNNHIIDKLKWNGTEHVTISYPDISSSYMGKIKPYKDDVYQTLVLDSLSNNQVTMIKGTAGTGKSFLALGYLLSLLDNHQIDTIIVFCNTVATVNSAKLGYYPGTKNEKLLDSSIGHMLSAKLGSSIGLESLVASEDIQLLPMSDIRGFDTDGKRAGIYITEAQNTDISLMKLALQRAGDDSICVIEGDYNAQVDMNMYTGSNNGMRRMSEVFRGQSFYGEVELQIIHRSRIAAIAELM